MLCVCVFVCVCFSLSLCLSLSLSFSVFCGIFVVVERFIKIIYLAFIYHNNHMVGKQVNTHNH
jgi:hypothetical protein